MKEQIYDIPAGFDLTIAVVADLHARDGTEVIQSINKRKPDLIAIPGDFVQKKRPQEHGKILDIPIVAFQKNVMPFLTHCSKIAPTFVSFGNHEAVLDEDDLALVNSSGVTILDNTFQRFNSGVVIGGLTAGHVINYRQYKASWIRTHGRTERYPSRSVGNMPHWFHVDAEWLNDFERQDGYKIFLNHHPEYWNLREPYLSEREIDLVLSGHAHGGQIRFFNKGLYAPGQGFFPKYTRGVWTGKNGKLVISAGLCNTSAIIPRIFNPTEIVYVNLYNSRCPKESTKEF
jgi:predicted MPP superfamily phosphohydrolase